MITNKTLKRYPQPGADWTRRETFVVYCLVGYVFVAGFWLGLRFPRHLWQGEAPHFAQEQVAPSATDEGAAADITAADELLTAISAQIRELSARREALSREAKEGRISYNLLRARGCADDSAECKGLTDRQRTLRADLNEVESDLEEVRRLYDRVVQASQRPHTGSRSSQADQRLRKDVREYLLRRPRPSSADAPIPNERWEGGPDKYMSTEDW